MKASLLHRIGNRLQLKLVLLLFFLFLAIPTMILVHQAYSQLKWEAFNQYRGLAEELTARIDNGFGELMAGEEQRSFAEYGFLVVSGDPLSNYLQPSPLSAFPVRSPIPGLIGYFQLNADGSYSTPLLPQPASRAGDYGISAGQLSQRQALASRLQQILQQNHLVQASGGAKDASDSIATLTKLDRRLAPQGPRLDKASRPVDLDRSSSVAGALAESEERSSGRGAEIQRLFDASVESDDSQHASRESVAPGVFGRVEDLKLGSRYETQGVAPEAYNLNQQARQKKRISRKEQSALPIVQALVYRDEPSALPEEVVAGRPEIKITMFESDIDPFDFRLMASGHFVLYRNVWREGQRYIQGAIVEQQAFLQGLIGTGFRDTGLSQSSELIVAYRDSVLAAFGGQGERDYRSSLPTTAGGERLYQARLGAPFGDLTLIYSSQQLPAGRGAAVIGWVTLALALVLSVGCLLLYRLGMRQIELARQQQDFVSSVSHELKTPLTSIRMYSEMLRAGWADEEKKQRYYDFIFEESERLSRLIENVLQLARMNRNALEFNLSSIAVATLLDGVRSKVSSQTERAGVELRLKTGAGADGALVRVDADAFIQLIINLVDNAIKFSVKAQNRAVNIEAHLVGTDSVVFSVRDYGSGVPRGQMKKIFQLFYRSETELTRETIGTGIGLALVQQLAQGMGGKVDVVNREPGSEFRLTLPLQPPV